MLKKLLSVVLVGLLIATINVSAVHAVSSDDKEARFIAQVKESIARLGTGVNARVEVKLRDNTKLKGYVSEAGEDSFIIVNAKTDMPVAVPYPQIKQVKGHNLSTGGKIAIGVGIGVGVLVVVILLFKDWIVGY
jgi:hypothetical protein